MADATDNELTDLLTKLYGIQEDIGAKPKTSDGEKKAKAVMAAQLGSNKKAAEKGSRFLSLKATIVDRLKTIHQQIKEYKEQEARGYGGDNAKETIKLKAEIRESIKQATDEWKELEELYKKEARKKRSKFTPEELETQQVLVERLWNEIQKVRDEQLKEYASGSRTPDASVAMKTQALYMDTGANKKNWAGTTGGGVALTDGQKQQIQQLEERDADFDLQLDEIGEGITDLAEIAQLQGEEVKRQNAMLQQLNTKMDGINERMVGVNQRMKETLEEVGRSSDKLCVDIMCIVLMIGFAGVIYNYAKGM